MHGLRDSASHQQLHDPGPEYLGWQNRELPQAEVTIWPGSGHFPHLAQPGRFAELLAATARWA